MSVAEYDPNIVDAVASTLELRAPNRDALDAVARALDTAEPGAELVADLATGVGKTYIAGGLLDYLWASGVRNVVIVTPGSTIQRKTINNLTPGHPKFLRGLQCRPTVITLDTLENGVVAAALTTPTSSRCSSSPSSACCGPDTKDDRRAHRDHETLGQSLSTTWPQRRDLVVIADEHHVYSSIGAATIPGRDLRTGPGCASSGSPPPRTTPRRPSGSCYRYPLADAIADGLRQGPGPRRPLGPGDRHSAPSWPTA